MTQKIALISQKGGSGKTTLAVHLAVCVLEAGRSVRLFDADPQGSALAWRQARQSPAPDIFGVTASRLPSLLEDWNGDWAIVDTAPHAGPDAARIAALVDLCLIPCRPTAFDLAAVGASVNLVQAAGTLGLIVMSACPFRAPEIPEMRNLLKDYGLPIARTQITDRRAFARAVSTGQAVTEFETHGKAAEEIRALWREIVGIRACVHQPNTSDYEKRNI